VSYLLDTCVISEFVRPRPSPRVVGWLQAQSEDELYLSVVTLGEVARGVARLPDGSRRRRLSTWLHHDLHQRFRQRLLPVSGPVALRWGEISGRAAAGGVQVAMADGIIGATAIVHGLVVVTQNVHDLAATGAVLFNPWADAAASGDPPKPLRQRPQAGR